LNAHNILKENKEHRVLALKDFQDEDFEDVLKRPAFCQKELHEKELLKFYCKVCEVPVCQTCVIVDHNKHEVEHLELAARAVQNEIASKLKIVKQSSQTFTGYILELEETSQKLEHCSQVTQEQIQKTAKSLVFAIQQQEKKLTGKVEIEARALLENSTNGKAKFQDQRKKTEEIIKQAERLLERSTGAELVRNKTAIGELFQGLQDPQEPNTSSTNDLGEKAPRYSQATTDLKTVTVFMKNGEISKCLQELGIGRVATFKTATEANQCSVERFQAATAGLQTEIEVITRNSKGEQYYCPEDYVTLELIPEHEDRNTAVDINIIDKNNGSYILSFIPSQAGKHLLTIQINGETIADFSLIDIKERSYMPVGFIGNGHIEGTKFKRPWGVTVNSSNEIFVTDMDNDRIVVFNEKGEFMRSFGQNFLTLSCPNGLIADNTGGIFVANRKSNNIVFFRGEGNFARTVHDAKSLKEPSYRGITLDSQGNLIVCDSENQCVKLISPHGEILKTIGRGWVMPNNCLFYKNKIFVADRDAHLIKVFSSTGRFLYEFGRYGSGDGELNKPTGLAVDKTGHLLVCSLGNNRVQVLLWMESL